jgi:hypothetical protein
MEAANPKWTDVGVGDLVRFFFRAFGALLILAAAISVIGGAVTLAAMVLLKQH